MLDLKPLIISFIFYAELWLSGGGDIVVKNHQITPYSHWVSTSPHSKNLVFFVNFRFSHLNPPPPPPPPLIGHFHWKLNIFCGLQYWLPQIAPSPKENFLWKTLRRYRLVGWSKVCTGKSWIRPRQLLIIHFSSLPIRYCHVWIFKTKIFWVHVCCYTFLTNHALHI